MFGKFSPPHQSMSFCSNVLKFVGREIGEIACYLPDKKNKIPAASQTVATVRIATKVCQGQPPAMCSQCSKSVHFRWSYSRMPEHQFFGL